VALQNILRNFIDRQFISLRGHTTHSNTLDFVKANFFADLSKKPSLDSNLSVQDRYRQIMAFREASTLPIKVSFPFRESLKEAKNLDRYFVEHRKDPNFGWYAVCLHGSKPEHTNDYNIYGFKTREEADYKWTELASEAPITTQWLKTTWPYDDFFRVRFVKLAPGGYITPHRDTDGERGYFAINICLNQPMGCLMVMEGFGIVPWAPGDVRLMDIGLRHAVVNLSNQNRYHMIIHGRSSSQESISHLQRFISANV
jgi:hypothetical protein